MTGGIESGALTGSAWTYLRGLRFQAPGLWWRRRRSPLAAAAVVAAEIAAEVQRKSGD